MSRKSTSQSEAKIASSEPPRPSFPLVGLGASAGGIRALQTFFETMPAETGMAFVIVMHLSPHHESNLAQVIQPHTSMPVLQVTQPTPITPNHVYVISPNRHLTLQNHHIKARLERKRELRTKAERMAFLPGLSDAGPPAILFVICPPPSVRYSPFRE